MKQYLDTLRLIRTQGREKGDRTGTGTVSYFSPPDMDFDLTAGFPLVTTKKVSLRLIIEELLWFITGSTNNNDLVRKNVHIWDEWADPDGDLGPIYGAQWRNVTGITRDGTFRNVDQLMDIIHQIKNSPDSRRMVVSAWNPIDLPDMRLSPCHALWQVNVHDGELSLKMYQRSADFFLGVPFNIASYALLTMMLAQVTGNRPGRYIHSFGDAHIYQNHIQQVDLQLSRIPFEMPWIKINPDVKKIEDFKLEDFEICDYHSHPAIKGEVSV